MTNGLYWIEWQIGNEPWETYTKPSVNGEKMSRDFEFLVERAKMNEWKPVAGVRYRLMMCPATLVVMREV